MSWERQSYSQAQQRKRAHVCNIAFEIEVQVEFKSHFGNRLEKQGYNYKVIALQIPLHLQKVALIHAEIKKATKNYSDFVLNNKDFKMRHKRL